MFKLVLDAGHGYNTAGKRCLKSLDPNETREWYLNSRICNKIESYLKDYEGYDLLRVDDVTGAKNISLATRAGNANKFNADFYLSIHHNAGIKGGSGGGVVAYVYNKLKANDITKVWQKELYDAIIKATGLKGNRATPLATATFEVLRKTKMPAVLLECGFMDSKTDVPIILTVDYADKVARAIVDVIVKRGGLTKKVVEQPAVSDKIYRVQVGAYRNRAYAENLQTELKSKGYDAIIV